MKYKYKTYTVKNISDIGVIAETMGNEGYSFKFLNKEKGDYVDYTTWILVFEKEIEDRENYLSVEDAEKYAKGMRK